MIEPLPAINRFLKVTESGIRKRAINRKKIRSLAEGGKTVLAVG
jgi:hypothetical protein